MNTSLHLLYLPNELLIDILKQSDIPKTRLVCRDFCDIIDSTPALWSSIYIGPKQYTPEALSLLNKHLERSVIRPLDVVIRHTETSTANTLATELWKSLATHRDRIRTFDVGTDTWILGGQIAHAVLLTPTPLSLPSLAKLDIRHDEEEDVPDQRAPMEPHTLLRPIATFFPALTTLILPLLLPCIPFPESAILSLTTLVLDGSVAYCCDYLWMTHIGQLLVRTPNLETFWCKEHRVYTHYNLNNLNSLPVDVWGCPQVHFPIVLPKLTTMSLALPGLGYDLLLVIEAPALQVLHMDGIRDDESYNHHVAWLSWFPGMMRAALVVTTLRSPELRRMSIVGAYLSRETWEWLLGCDASTHGLPFPHLDSIAVHQLQAIKDQVTNVFDDALIKSYARQGRLGLRRFVYRASKPPLGSVALQRLINSISERRRPGQVFELELDGAYDLDAKEGVRLIVHKERPQRKNWFTLGKDIDPTEDDSY